MSTTVNIAISSDEDGGSIQTMSLVGAELGSAAITSSPAVRMMKLPPVRPAKGHSALTAVLLQG
jgi:hypothetical protein